MLVDLRRIPLVTVRVPVFEEHARALRERLLLADGESATICGFSTMLQVPEVFWTDCEGMLGALAPHGWTMGRLLGFLAVQGAIRLLEAEQDEGACAS